MLPYFLVNQVWNSIISSLMTKIEEDFPFFPYLREKCEKRSGNKPERLRATKVPNENDG